MVNLVVGQKTTLTATLLNSLSQPVTGVDPRLIVWSVDDSTICAITPSTIVSTNSGAPNPIITGYTVTLFALAAGPTNVTVTYNNQGLILQNVTQVVVAANGSASIAIAQGPIT